MSDLSSFLFLLKKFISGLIMPVSLILLLLIWAIVFLLRRKTRWFGILMVVLATALLFAASYPPLSAKLISSLEKNYPQYQPTQARVDFVAVLGSSHVSSESQPLTSQISPAGIIRMVEGIRIYRLNPGSKLVFTGYNGRQPDSYADKISQLAHELGVPEQDILTFTGPRDTAEEAKLLAEKFSGRQLVLVTDATHMPRAMSLCRRAGFEPIPAPTGHLNKPVQSWWTFPNAETLSQTTRWLHERLGLLWSNLTWKIKKSQPAEQH